MARNQGVKSAPNSKRQLFKASIGEPSWVKVCGEPCSHFDRAKNSIRIAESREFCGTSHKVFVRVTVGIEAVTDVANSVQLIRPVAQSVASKDQPWDRAIVGRHGVRGVSPARTRVKRRRTDVGSCSGGTNRISACSEYAVSATVPSIPTALAASGEKK